MTSLVEGRTRDDARVRSTPAPVTNPTPAGEPGSGRVHYFDYLRLFGTLGVVLIHSANEVYSTAAGKGTGQLGLFTVSGSMQAAGRFAVGCFFMMSGALLLDSSRRFRLGRQLRRIVVPLLVWSGVYLLVDAWWRHRGLPTTLHAVPADSIATVAKAVLASSIGYQFWFVYALVACYLALPLLRPITALADPRRKRLLEYALAVWAITFVIVPTIDHFAPGAIAPYPDLVPAVPSQYLGFVVLGYYLHRYGVQIAGWRPGRPALFVAAGSSLLAIIALTLWDQIRGVDSGWSQTNPTPQVVVFAASTFLLAKSYLNRPGKHFGFVSLFSRLSFRIYLVHVLFVFWLSYISPMKHFYRTAPVLSIAIIWTVSLTVSFGIAYGLERIRSIRAYV